MGSPEQDGVAMSNELSVYRSSDDAELLRRDNERLKSRIEELELRFVGMIPFQKSRDKCPFCSQGETPYAKIMNETVPARERSFWRRKAVPAHLKRHHNGCGASWIESLPPGI